MIARAVCALAGLVLAGLPAGAFAACPANHRTMQVSGFPADAESRLMAIEIQGVSLKTPWDNIRAILVGKGFDEIRSTRPDTIMEFIRGDRTPLPGEVTHTFLARRDAGGIELSYGRRTGDGRISPSDPTLYSQRPIREDAEVQIVRDIKKLICDAIPDPIQKHDACRPDTDQRISAGSVGKETIILSEHLQVTRLMVSPLGVTITLRKCS